jgi:methylphosphotriester-DNA--protein-cysteine methyltransferase
VAFPGQLTDNVFVLTRAEMIQGMFNGDTTLDGLFIVAVRTTGIYCRPSCRPPRRPKPENVEFFGTPFEAKQAGFRPCKLCRPDGAHPTDLEKRVVDRLIANAQHNPAMFQNASDMACAAGTSVSRLYKLFRAHRGTTPTDVLTRIRVQAACQRLDETDQPITQIALEVGFQSLSAFNANFRRVMQTSPIEYRRSHARSVPSTVRRAA